MSNDIIMYVQTENGMVELHPETIASQVKLSDGVRTLEDFFNERDFIKYADGFLHIKKPDGSFEPINTQSDIFPLKPTSSVSIESLEGNVAVKWTDPNDITIETSTGTLTLVKWAGSRLVAKEGSVPMHINDGITLVDSTIRDQYSSNAFVATLEKNKVYYLKIFPYSTHGGYTSNGDSLSVNTSDIRLEDIVANVTTVDSNIYATWGDPKNVTKIFNGIMMDVNSWVKTVLVIKDGSVPTSITDGETIIENLERDKYKTAPLIIEGNIEGTKFVKIFSVDEDGVINDSMSPVQLVVSHGILKSATNLNLAKVGKNVSVTWTDPVEDTVISNGLTVKTATWNKSVLVMKNGSSPTGISDGIMIKESLIYNEFSSDGFLVENVSLDVDVHFAVFSISTNNTVSMSVSSHIMIPNIPIPEVTGPGPSMLIAGDNKAGFFGEVPNTELITPLNLATTINLTVGTAQHNDTPWLKFIIDDKVIFVSKKPIRHRISWDQLNAVGVIKGTKFIYIGGNAYKVRLMKGAVSDPYNGNSSDREAIGSEWNRLMLPIHTHAKDQSWDFPQFTGTNVPNWGVGYTDADLLTESTYGYGSHSWCQETIDNTPLSRSLRGYNDVSDSGYSTSTNTSIVVGWRPVLELVDPSEVIDKSNSPGSPVLLAGDASAGFFGEVPNSQLITPTALATTIGLTAGSAQYNISPWLKFIIDGKIIFVTKNTVRNNISWDQINAVGAVKGTKIIGVGGKYYKVRLMRGTLTDPSSNEADHGAIGSEWNRLMLPIHVEASTGNWETPTYAGTGIPDWGIGYTNGDLTSHPSMNNGSYTWCQETLGTNGAYRIMRGSAGISHLSTTSPSTVNIHNGWRPVLELIDPSEYDDLTDSPGSPVLVAGDTSAGFFGEVPNTELITPVNLAKDIGLNAGYPQNDSSPWLKFIIDGKIIFVAKKTVRYNVPWNSIDTVGAVKGTKTINIGEDIYKVRLMKGALTEPTTTGVDHGAIGSEWNRLMLPIHVEAATGSWAQPQYVESGIPDWGIKYTNTDLWSHNTLGNGTYAWCQETLGMNTAYRISRGYSGISSLLYNDPSSEGTHYGWRPVLELVPKQ